MSPEQLDGKDADTRSDIFAFGAVFYQMITGRRAFDGQRQARVMAAILDREPADMAPGTPAALARVVCRCLEKDPERRWQSARDLAAELEWLLEPAPAAPEPRAPRSGTRRIYASVLLALAAATWLWFHLRSTPAPAWMGLQLGGRAVALGPRVSPDGQMVAFQTLVDGQTQAAIMKPESGNWTVLTHQMEYGFLGDLCWSRDGTKIYFDRLTDAPHGIFSVPVLGGEARMVLEDAMGPQALPDGSLIVARINAERRLQLHHFWPANERLDPLAAVVPLVAYAPVRATTDGTEVIYFGSPLPRRADTPDRLYALNLASGRSRVLAPALSIPAAFGREVSTKSRAISTASRRSLDMATPHRARCSPPPSRRGTSTSPPTAPSTRTRSCARSTRCDPRSRESHACDPPAAMATALVTPNTACATGCAAVSLPFPSCPLPPAPQQLTAPVAERAHVNEPLPRPLAPGSIPAEIATMLLSPGTWEAKSLKPPAAPVPIWPAVLSPQQ